MLIMMMVSVRAVRHSTETGSGSIRGCEIIIIIIIIIISSSGGGGGGGGGGSVDY
jgi:hypothetical protein